MKINRIIAVLISVATLATLMISCSDDATKGVKGNGIERPYEPWIFRSVLDQSPRMVTLALHDKLWAAYRTTTGGLYKAWRGEVLFDGPVYTNNHGPQPMTIGDAYVENNEQPVWKLTDAGGSEIPSTFQYKGHKVVDDKATLMYELTDEATKSVIRIEEQVETSESDLGDMILHRSFTTSMVPDGKQVVLSTTASSIVTKENVTTDLSQYDITKMVEYVMSLDADTEGNEDQSTSVKSDMNAQSPSKMMKLEETIPGAVTVIYKQKKGVQNIDGMQTRKATNAGIMPNFDNISGADFANNRDNFGLVAEGYLVIEKENSYNFRIWSDDGSRVTLNDKVILDNDGLHGTDYKEAAVTLTEGLHPFKVEYFQGEGGSYLSWNWKPSGSEMWMVVPANNIVHAKDMQSVIGDLTLPMANITKVPGDGYNA